VGWAKCLLLFPDSIKAKYELANQKITLKWAKKEKAMPWHCFSKVL
jgi:hypothetical protein